MSFVFMSFFFAILHLFVGKSHFTSEAPTMTMRVMISLERPKTFECHSASSKKIALVFSTAPHFIVVHQQWTMNNHRCLLPFSAFGRQETGSSCLNDTIIAPFSCKQLIERFEDCG